MVMKAIVSDINSVDESLRSHYKEVNGRHVLDVEPAEVKGDNGTSSYYALEDTHGLRSALQKERATARTAQSALDKFADLDASTVRGSLAELETLRGQNGDLEEKAATLAQGKIDQLVTKHQTDLDASTQSNTKLRGTVEDLMIDRSLAEAIRKNGGDEGTVTLLMPHIKGQVALREVGDSLYTEVVDKTTKEPRIGDSTGAPMSLEQLVVEFRNSETFSSAFPGTGNTGGGTGSSGKGGSGFPSKKGDFNTTQRSDFIEKNGALGWLNLPE